jgi:hypothetical protein
MAALTSVQQEILDAQVDLLWAVVGRAVEDATGTESGFGQRDCPWWPDEAMASLTRMLGPGHRITRGVMQARAEGREIHVSVH